MKLLSLMTLAFVLTTFNSARANPLEKFQTATYSMTTKLSTGGPLRDLVFRRIFGPIIGDNNFMNQGPEDVVVTLENNSIAFNNMSYPLSGCVKKDVGEDEQEVICVTDESYSEIEISYKMLRKVYWQEKPEVVENSTVTISKLSSKKFKVVHRDGSDSETYTFTKK